MLDNCKLLDNIIIDANIVYYIQGLKNKFNVRIFNKIAKWQF